MSAAPESTGGADGKAADGTTDGAQAAEQPFFRITRGNPSPTEVGVLAAVFATAQGNGLYAGDHGTGVRDDWGTYADRLRPPFGYNPGSFRNLRQY